MLEAGHDLAVETLEPLLEVEIVEDVLPVANPRVAAFHPVEDLCRARAHDRVRKRITTEEDGRGLVEIAPAVGAIQQKAAHPVADELELARGMPGQCVLRLREGGLGPFGHQVLMELGHRSMGFLAHDDRVAAGELVKQVFTRRRGAFGGVETRPLDERGHQRAQLSDVLLLRRVAGEEAIAFGESCELRGPERAGVVGCEAMPPDERARASVGVIPRQLQCLVRGRQCVQDACAVEIVQASRVRLAVAPGRELLHEGEPLVPGGCGDADGAIARRPRLQHPPGQVLGPIHVGVFRHDVLVPHIARGQKRLVVDRLEVARAGEVQVRRVVAIRDREIECLGIDVEPVPAELNDTLTAGEELLPVLQLPHGFLLHALQAARQIVGLDGIFEREQLLDGLADPGDHQVRRHVRVDVLERREAGQTVPDDAEDALGSGHQAGRAPVPLLDQRELALLERLVQLRAPIGKLDRVVLEVGERAFQLLELHGDAIQVVVTLRGRVAQVEVAGR